MPPIGKELAGIVKYLALTQCCGSAATFLFSFSSLLSHSAAPASLLHLVRSTPAPPPFSISPCIAAQRPASLPPPRRLFHSLRRRPSPLQPLFPRPCLLAVGVC
ncbi:hypothetical protein Ahy_A09g046025 isoform B [Arachis hypogaea]|uniref:Uncharacterized protein n=1 Tax=Arachis hypogaea TaxID=3818 RepID=A0A445BNP2_ARAHY|nr:hypothetical protein Ahy_A09g046025 isoform B [Arachis hypogaea]